MRCCGASTSVPWWSRRLRTLLFRRERRALTVLARSVLRRRSCSPDGMLVRGWIDGVPLHIAKPHGDAGYFRSAKAALAQAASRRHRHNDLAKEQNWLYADGRAYLTDFQLASLLSARRSAAVPHRALRGPAPSAQAQAPLRARQR